MYWPHNTKGISPITIVLFGVLVLTVVLVNAISITHNQKSQIKAQEQTVLKWCGQPYPAFPSECPVAAIQRCGSHYILQTNCVGTGKVILTADGQRLGWCDYTSLDTPTVSCQTMVVDIGRCLSSKNVCS